MISARAVALQGLGFNPRFVALDGLVSTVVLLFSDHGDTGGEMAAKVARKKKRRRQEEEALLLDRSYLLP